MVDLTLWQWWMLEKGERSVTREPPGASDWQSLIQSRQYRVLLGLAAVIGLVVSTAAWAFLEAVHEIEVGGLRRTCP